MKIINTNINKEALYIIKSQAHPGVVTAGSNTAGGETGRDPEQPEPASEGGESSRADQPLCSRNHGDSWNWHQGRI